MQLAAREPLPDRGTSVPNGVATRARSRFISRSRRDPWANGYASPSRLRQTCSCKSVARSSASSSGQSAKHAEDRLVVGNFERDDPGFAVGGAFEPFGGGDELSFAVRGAPHPGVTMRLDARP